MSGSWFLLVALILGVGASASARAQARGPPTALPASTLIDVVVDEHQAYPLRREALQAACVEADAVRACELLGIMRLWASELGEADTGASHRPSVPLTGARFGLISIFVRDCAGLLDTTAPADNLAFLETVALGCGFSPETKEKCYQQIAASVAPLPLRRECALGIIERMPNRLDPPKALVPLLDVSSFPRVRKLVRSSIDPDKFHFPAAGALSLLGDTEIVADLERLKPAFRAKHPNFEGHLTRYQCRIKSQHPPTKLIDYIASSELAWTRRPWAVRRAVELGVPTAQIRQAILAHARQVKPTGKFGIRPGLATLKKVALEFGVLHLEDLPDVQIPETAPTP